MRRATLLTISLALLLAVACASGDQEVTGIVVAVDGELESVEGFAVLADGERIEFETVPGGDYAFPLGHLQDHLRSGEPVLVRWEEEGDRRVATFIDDA